MGASIKESRGGADNSFQKKGKQVSEMMAYCGLVCQTCPIYLATREENKEEQARRRVEIARLCKEHYGMNYEPADITDCDGCRMEGGRLFSGSKECAIRKCARQKGLENCAHCTDYVCGKLEAFFAADPPAKARLDQVRSSIP
jgi:hypothetical protein